MWTKKKNYDLIFGMGDLCQCSQTLRRHDLQRASYPCDWLLIPNLSLRTDNLLNGFKDFPAIEDLEFTNSHTQFDTYTSKKHKIVMAHDFAKGRPLAQTYEAVKQKYARRFERFYAEAAQAKTILVVLMRGMAIEPLFKEEEVLQNYSKWAAAWPHAKVDLLFVEHVEGQPKDQMVYTQLAPHVLKASANYKEEGPGAVVLEVDRDVLHKIFTAYRLNIPFKDRFKRSALALVAALLPSSSMRAKFKKKHHIERG